MQTEGRLGRYGTVATLVLGAARQRPALRERPSPGLCQLRFRWRQSVAGLHAWLPSGNRWLRMQFLCKRINLVLRKVRRAECYFRFGSDSGFHHRRTTASPLERRETIPPEYSFVYESHGIRWLR